MKITITQHALFPSGLFLKIDKGYILMISCDDISKHPTFYTVWTLFLSAHYFVCILQ